MKTVLPAAKGFREPSTRQEFDEYDDVAVERARLSAKAQTDRPWRNLVKTTRDIGIRNPSQRADEYQ